MSPADHIQRLQKEVLGSRSRNLDLNLGIVDIHPVIDIQEHPGQLVDHCRAVCIFATQIYRLIPVVTDGGKLQEEICKVLPDLLPGDAIFQILLIAGVKQSVKIGQRRRI